MFKLTKHVTVPDPKTSTWGAISPQRRALLGLGVVALVFILGAALTWRKWPDMLIDFGTQLYIPWRILHGAVLYRDLFYFGGGPFSQYFDALLFKIFGVSFSTLIAADLLFTAAMILVIYRSFSRAADVWTATLIGVAIAGVFAFSEFGPVGNFTYVAPYGHEMLHGLVLSVFTIALLCRWIKKGEIWVAALAGFCTGLVFLSKPDAFTALVMAIIASLVLFYVERPRSALPDHGHRRQGACATGMKSLAAFAVAGIVPVLFFFFYFIRIETWKESLSAVAFAWVPILQGKIVKNSFYLWCTGLDHPAAHLRDIAVYFIAIVLVVTFYAVVLRWIKNVKWKPTSMQYFVLLLLVSPLVFWAVTFNWIDCGWPLPLLCASACVLIIWNYKSLPERPTFPLLWSIFGLALLAKLGLFPRIWHYGFALAMPAFVSSIYLLFWLLPRSLETKYGISGFQFRAIAGLVFLIGFASLFNRSQSLYATKSQPLGTGGDTIVTYNMKFENTQAYYGAMLWTEKFMPPDATMAAVPQGIMLNYLTRHVNPTGCLFWDPSDLSVFGQTNMTAAFERNAPDYIFIVDWKAGDYKAEYFGSSPEYGQDLMQWINKNYKFQILFDDEPLKDGKFGIKILKRAEAGGVSEIGTNRYRQ